jgi:hypothetical protein
MCISPLWTAFDKADEAGTVYRTTMGGGGVYCITA